MRRNVKIPKRMSVVAGITLHFGAIIAVAFLVGILHVLSSTSCSQLEKSIGEKKRVLDGLENDRLRVLSEWEGMKTPDSINSALVRHGLKMRNPEFGQIVRLNADGKPQMGQLSVRRIKKRMDTVRYGAKR